MKTKIYLFWLIFTFVLLSFSAISMTITKEWIVRHGPGVKMGCWEFMWEDEWGGSNYQCKPCGFVGCSPWSWRAVYEGMIDPCAECNTEQYGRNLIDENTPEGELPPLYQIDFS